MLAKDKAYVCNQCRKVITYSRTDAGKTIPCPFCKAPAKLPVAADLIVSERRDKPAKKRLFFAAAVLAATALVGVFLFVRTPTKASPAVQAIAPVFRLLQKNQPVAVPGTARARGQQATLGVTDVVYGCPEIRESALNRTSLTQTPVCCVPCENIGGKGNLRFSIPRDIIR